MGRRNTRKRKGSSEERSERDGDRGGPGDIKQSREWVTIHVAPRR